MKRDKEKLPKIGLRIIKSTIAVFLCFVIRVYQSTSPFYTALAALQTIQPYKQSSRTMAVQRIQGTLIGAIFGLVTILIEYDVFVAVGFPTVTNYVLIAAGVCGVLYTSVLLHKKNTSYFSCVVYLSIVMVHLGDSNPYLFVLQRTMDTFLGVAIGIIVNQCHLPKKMKKDVLFISGFDNVLVGEQDNLSDFSRVKLNRMLDDGLPFTMMTMRTPASLLESINGIRLQLPVIVMNGAALYDIKNNQYLKVLGIPRPQATLVQEFFAEHNQNCFINTIEENTVMIHYQTLQNEGEKNLYQRLRKSPYRNYTQSVLSDREEVAYFMAFDECSRIYALVEQAKEDVRTKDLQIICYESQKHPYFAYLKIYHPGATKQNMLEELKKQVNMTQSCTIGSIPHYYDVVVDEKKRGDEVVRLLEKLSRKKKYENKS